jgi:predicted nucleic acid-binding protein
VLATAIEYGATVYDAVYITLSRSLDLPLLTAERSTTPWVVKLGRRVQGVG